MIITLLILLLTLEEVIPNIINIPFLFFIIGLIVILSMFKYKDNKMYIILFIIGMLYDLSYTNFIFIHALIYPLIFYILNKKVKFKSNNFLYLLFLYYISILFYSLILYLYSIIITSSINILIFNRIINCMLINTIYFTILYMIYFVTIYLFSNRLKEKNIPINR